MKRTFFILLAIVSLSVVACEKDENIPSAKGYWKGMISFYDAALMNHENGTSRLYVQVPDGDTAATIQLKADGYYTENGRLYRGVFYPGGSDSLVLELTQTSAGELEGRVINPATPGVSLPVDLHR